MLTRLLCAGKETTLSKWDYYYLQYRVHAFAAALKFMNQIFPCERIVKSN